jgi:acylphosphatase
MMVSKHVVYRGRVQGVGFRYTAREIAERFGVTGYVRNLRGGDVELAVEGTPEIVDAYLAALAERMAGYITDSAVSECAPAGYIDFQVRY